MTGEDRFELLSVATWYTLMVGFFYLTGHQETISSIRWSSGLVGLQVVSIHNHSNAMCIITPFKKIVETIVDTVFTMCLMYIALYLLRLSIRYS